MICLALVVVVSARNDIYVVLATVARSR